MEKKTYNKAKIVIARDLLKIIYRVLKTKEPYYKENNKPWRLARSKGFEVFGKTNSFFRFDYRQGAI